MPSAAIDLLDILAMTFLLAVLERVRAGATSPGNPKRAFFLWAGILVAGLAGIWWLAGLLPDQFFGRGIALPAAVLWWLWTGFKYAVMMGARSVVPGRASHVG